jgi:O-antigen/teichoic acid export membrane protein
VLIELFIQKSGYAQSLQYLPYIAVIYILKTMRLYFVIPYSVLKKMQRLTVLNFFTSLLKVGLMIWMISKWQLFGVIISSLLVHAVEVVLLWYYLRNDYEMRFNVFKLMIAPVMLLLIVMFAEPLIGLSYPLLTHMGYCVLCAGLLWFAYRNEIRVLDPFKIVK